jgi:uncharacterized integral membrane protein
MDPGLIPRRPIAGHQRNATEKAILNDGGDDMASMKLIVALILATGLVVFGAQNTQSVTFHFLMFDLGPVPVTFVVFVAALLGMIVGWLVSVPGRLRSVRTRRQLEHEVTAAHQETAAAITDMEESRARARPSEGRPPATQR